MKPVFQVGRRSRKAQCGRIRRTARPSQGQPAQGPRPTLWRRVRSHPEPGMCPLGSQPSFCLNWRLPLPVATCQATHRLQWWICSAWALWRPTWSSADAGGGPLHWRVGHALAYEL